MKNFFAILTTVAIAACGTHNDDRDSTVASSHLDAVEISSGCPTSPLKGFTGTFKGVLSPVNFQGDIQTQQNLTETHTITGCTSFDFDVHYSNPQTGVETRQVKFTALWNKSKKVFDIAGPVIQGQFRVLRDGQFVASFETNFAGSPAHCEEMMTVTNNDQQVMRSVQCGAGGLNGSSLGVRNALVSRVQ